MIDSIALLHQYQRPIKTLDYGDRKVEYVEVELLDIETANRLAHEVLGRTLDELPTQTRKLLKAIQNVVVAGCKEDGVEKSDYRFSRRNIREEKGWGLTQVAVHCQRLEAMEYLLIHHGHRGHSKTYELLYDDCETDQGYACRV